MSSSGQGVFKLPKERLSRHAQNANFSALFLLFHMWLNNKAPFYLAILDLLTALRMTYFTHGFHTSPAQLQKLARGENVTFSADRLDGPHRLHLSKSQLNKVMKARRDGKGVRLQFTPAQLQHNVVHGEGLWSSIKSIGLAGAKAAGSHVLNNAGAIVNGAVKGYQSGGLSGAALGAGTSAITGKGILGAIGGALGSMGDSYFGFGLGRSAPHMVKGSAAAKAHMARLRAMRRTTRGKGLLMPGQ